MRREFHVRFCEGGGVRFPSATRPVMVFACEADARRMMAVLPKRFGRYGLALHPEKTRSVPFNRPPYRGAKDDTGTFDLLGFTHSWTKSRNGYWVIKRKTAKSRLQRSLKRVAEWCKEHRHMPVHRQAQVLGQKLRGHYGYFGITGNSRSVALHFHRVCVMWRHWLDRRAQHRHMPWSRFKRMLERHPLPGPVCVHSQYRKAANP